MPSLILKDIPSDIYDLLASNAAGHRQSIADEAVQCIAKVLSHQVHSQKLLEDLRRLRRNMPILNAPSEPGNNGHYPDTPA